MIFFSRDVNKFKFFNEYTGKKKNFLEHVPIHYEDSMVWLLWKNMASFLTLHVE
jgi:hypothetical protein